LRVDEERARLVAGSPGSGATPSLDRRDGREALDRRFDPEIDGEPAVHEDPEVVIPAPAAPAAPPPPAPVPEELGPGSLASPALQPQTTSAPRTARDAFARVGFTGK
jgi:hypothetical protein